MVSRKSMLLAGSIVGVLAVVAAISVQAQDGQQSSRRTHRTQEQSVPKTTPPASGTPTPAKSGEPTPADPVGGYRGTTPPATPPATGSGAGSQDTDAQHDPFFSARRQEYNAPRQFGGDAGTQLPAHQSETEIPGSLKPDDAANALRPVPQDTLQPTPDPVYGSSQNYGSSDSAQDSSAQDTSTQDSTARDPFGQFPTRAAPSTSANSSPQGISPFDRFATRTTPRVERGAALTGGSTLFRQQAPSLVVEAKGPAEVIVGREAVLRVQLFNEGDLPSRDIVLSMELPSGVELTGAEPTGGRMETAPNSSGGLRWRIDSVNPGGGESLTLKVIPSTSQPLNLRMKWSTAAAEATAQLKVLEPKLQLAVTGPKEIAYGEKAVYTMTFSNSGTADAEDVEVMLMPLEPGDDPETHEIGTIAAGSKRDVEIELVPKQTGTLQIRAQATALGGLVSQVSEDILIRRAGIKIEMEGPNFRYAKTPATYRVRVTNPGNDTAKGLQLGAILPPGAAFVSASHEGMEEDGGRVRWRLDQLAAGAVMEIELRCELAQAGPNRVEAVALADGELRASHEVTTDVEALADLNLNVRDPKGPVPVGEKTDYEIVISNRGTKSAERIEIIAYFSEGIEPVAVSGATHQLRPGMVILGPLPVLPADDQAVIKVTAVADRPGNHQFRVELKCVALDTELAEQKMTRFYGDARSDASTHGTGIPSPSRATPMQSTGGYPDANPLQPATQSSTSDERLDTANSGADRYSAWPSAGNQSPTNASTPTPVEGVPTPADNPVRYGQDTSDSETTDRYGDRYGVSSRATAGGSSGQPTPVDQQSSRRQAGGGQ